MKENRTESHRIVGKTEEEAACKADGLQPPPPAREHVRRMVSSRHPETAYLPDSMPEERVAVGDHPPYNVGRAGGGWGPPALQCRKSGGVKETLGVGE